MAGGKRMNIQIFGTNKSFDTKKAQRWFKDQDTLALLRWLDESQQADKLFENQQLLRQPIVRNGRAATVGYRPEVWEKWE